MRAIPTQSPINDGPNYILIEFYKEEADDSVNAVHQEVPFVGHSMHESHSCNKTPPILCINTGRFITICFQAAHSINSRKI